MEMICDKRCDIGEGPVWNQREQKLYYVNPREREICILDIYDRTLEVRRLDFKVSSLAFCKSGRMLVSCPDGIFYLDAGNNRTPLYAAADFTICNANDAKVGPDGRFYVGTQSHQRLGLSDRRNGTFYSIDHRGTVRELFGGMRLSNGFDWSMDETTLYHTDSDTNLIRVFRFEKDTGNVTDTGRAFSVPGVDGFTVDRQGYLWVACWGRGCLAKVDPERGEIVERKPVPTPICASCAFAGRDMEYLIAVTGYYGLSIAQEPNAGFTFAQRMPVGGRTPYLFADE